MTPVIALVTALGLNISAPVAIATATPSGIWWSRLSTPPVRCCPERRHGVRHRSRNKAAVVAPATAGADGVASIPRLAPGRYSVKAEFTGFETRLLPDVRVRNGANKQVLMLPIEGHKETVLVGQDQQEAAATRAGPVLRHRLDARAARALSDDPTSPAQQLQDMAGPGAVIKVDQLRGRRAAAQGADPVDPHLARSVRGRISQCRRHLDRDHHAAGRGTDPLRPQPPDGGDPPQRPQSVHADAGPGARTSPTASAPAAR